MSEARNVEESAESSGSRRRHHPLVLVLAALLFVEAAALAATTVVLIFDLLVATPDSFPSAIALTVCVAIATVWVFVIALNSLRGRAWIRGAAIVVQVLLGALALGSFTGMGARVDVGWLLLAPAIAVLVLLFTKPVLAETSRRDV